MFRHRLYSLALAASMSLFVVTFTPFVWSFISEDAWTISRHQAGVDCSENTIELSQGYFMFTRYQGRLHPRYSVGEGVTVDYPPLHLSRAPHRDALDYDDIAGFGVSHRHLRDGPVVHDERTLFIPLWTILLISLTLPRSGWHPTSLRCCADSPKPNVTRQESASPATTTSQATPAASAPNAEPQSSQRPGPDPSSCGTAAPGS